jgi:hypothetical protein
MSVMQIGFVNEALGDIAVACVGAQCANEVRETKQYCSTAFLNSLEDIREGCRAVLLGFTCFLDFMHFTVSLVYCTMSLAKAELMVW